MFLKCPNNIKTKPEKKPAIRNDKKNLIAKEYYLKAKIKNRVILKF
ncbi:hypothetical protein G177_gp13 [Helicobacter phage KHP40]|uniref:Uncharacterized protein n=1 Tax=Helicobacter phage KHP40 TaxID=1204178 RepID=I7H8A2_9CAUD|nr:hypothetical protein G177_gp13 [Helicobacter phage KHP40]BAM34785.1 hypothetical protein [Helicobacter phage KHP40]